MRRPVVQLKDLAISPIYSPKLTLPARQGRRVVLWAGSRGCGRLGARVPVPVRVQAAALRKASGHGVAKASLFIRSLHTCPLLVELGDRRGLVLHGCNRSVHDAAAAARVECGCVPEPVKLRQSESEPEGARWSCAAA